MPGAIGYFRVSTKEQANENNSLPVQEGKFKSYCTSNSLTILCTFIDKQSARTRDDRPQLQRMLEYCKKNRKQISCVVVADLSRLARNVIDQGQVIIELSQLGIKLISVDEPSLDDSAAGKLLKNVLGSMNQFFSDSLSEKTKFRMQAGVKQGRWLWVAPLGYLNDKKSKTIVIDPARAPLVRKAFEMVANGGYATSDAVLRQITAMGLTTRKGRKVKKQTFSRMLMNPFYSGWIVSDGSKIQGTHVPLVSEDVFSAVQQRVRGNGIPHKKVNEDFPLRGFVRCASCGKPLTAGWAKGRKERYPRYWCYQKGCGAVGISREDLELHFFRVLGTLEPVGEFLAQLPTLAARSWEARKARISDDAKTLSTRLADQRSLNQKAIVAKLNGELSAEDFEVVKRSTSEEITRIEEQIKALDSERSTMEDLVAQTECRAMNFAQSWKSADINGKHEIQYALFPTGLAYSHEKRYFEPANESLIQAFRDMFDSISLIGVPDGI